MGDKSTVANFTLLSDKIQLTSAQVTFVSRLPNELEPNNNCVFSVKLPDS